MHPYRIAELRKETVSMFYHGFDNYMKLAFPEDEVCQILHTATTIVQFTHEYTLVATSVLYSPDPRPAQSTKRPT